MTRRPVKVVEYISAFQGLIFGHVEFFRGNFRVRNWDKYGTFFLE
jgi:hypothetical protein